jgi:flagellar motor component MotA
VSLTSLREAFYNASQEQENEALANLVNAYHKSRKEALKPIYRVDLIKHTKAVYAEPDNTMRLNWNE